MTGSATVVPAVAWDRFPVTVHLPGGGTLRDARLVLTCPRPDLDRSAGLYVWVVPGDPTEVAALDLEASLIGPPRRTWELATDLGTYVVEPGRGCGCGNRLKTWQPFEPMLMGAPSCLRT